MSLGQYDFWSIVAICLMIGYCTNKIINKNKKITKRDTEFGEEYKEE